MKQEIILKALRITVICCLLLFSVEAFTMIQKQHTTVLEELEFRLDELYISTDVVSLKQIINTLSNSRSWKSFIDTNNDGFVYIDARSGRPVLLTSTISVIPGSGMNNTITLDDLSGDTGYRIELIPGTEIEQVALRFVEKFSSILNVNVEEIGEIRAGNPLHHLWQIFITRQYNSIPVRDANIAITINHGNVILWGVEKWGDISLDTHPALTQEDALHLGMRDLSSRNRSAENSVLPILKMVQQPHIEIIPVAPVKWDGTVGKGYEYILAWVFKLKAEESVNIWEMLIDAHDGRLLSFQDITPDVVVGAVYPLSNDECCPEGCAESYASMSGAIQTGGCTDLNGIIDQCGAINECSSTYYIDMGGSNGQHDCTIPMLHSAGDTFASRTAFHELRDINSIAKSWVYYSWLDTNISITINTTDYCSASWTGSGISCARSGNGCRNTCEIPGVLIHEWAHGLDFNDTNGMLSNPQDVFGDALASLKLHNSCIGRGFFWTLNNGCGQWTNCPTDPGTSYGYNCSGYGDCCLNCTGFREIDYAGHASATPHTPANFICTSCSSGTGPCGKEVHCEIMPAAEAIWDLAARDLQTAPFNYDKQTAFMITTRLAYIGSGNVTNWYTCSCPNTSHGCGVTNAYMQWIGAEDDNGNVNDGTPHMTAIYAAFNRHGIACSAAAPVNSGCSAGPNIAPVITATPGDKTVSLSWNSVPDANSYVVFRTEGALGCDSGKYKIATVTTTNYTDSVPLNNKTYYYTVMAVGANQACYSPLSNCVSAMPVPACPPEAIENTLFIFKSGENLNLNWFPWGCCQLGFSIYRGTLPLPGYDHLPLSCTITSLSYTTPADTGSYYFLVVPHNNNEESCYGRDTSGNERPQSTFPCYPQDTSNCYSPL